MQVLSLHRYVRNRQQLCLIISVRTLIVIIEIEPFTRNVRLMRYLAPHLWNQFPEPAW